MDTRHTTTRQPFPNATEADHLRMAEMAERIDEVATRPTILPPSHGAPQRQAIESITDDVVQTTCAKIDELRKVLDALQQSVLSTSADAKTKLVEMVGVCAGVNDEIVHMRAVVDDIARRANS